MGTQHIIRKSLLFALPAFTMTINVRIEIKLHIIHDLANMIFRVDSRVESTSYCTSVLPPPPCVQDGFKTYKCRTKHRLTGETKLSATAGRLVITGRQVVQYSL